MEKLWSHPTIRQRLWLNRGDVGFGQEGIMAWHEIEGELRPEYLFKLKLTTNVRAGDHQSTVAAVRRRTHRGLLEPVMHF